MSALTRTLGGGDVLAVTLVNPTTGDAYTAGGAPDGATATNQSSEIALLQTVRDRLPSAFLTPNLLPVDVNGTPVNAQTVTATGTAQNIWLLPGTRRVSMYAMEHALYRLNTTAGTSHFIGKGERIVWNVPPNSYIRVTNYSIDGLFFVTEFS